MNRTKPTTIAAVGGKNTLTSLQYQAALTAVEREACQKSFKEFIISFWSVVIEEGFEDNWHIGYLCSELQKLSINIVARKPKLYDVIINIPPGTTKSTITTIMYPTWLWTQDPSLRVITNSYAADLSIEHAVKSRDIITSDKYRRLFPEVELRRDKSAKSSYENTHKGARYTTSTGGTITGKHAHVIINDDPVNPKQAGSKPKREEANTHTKTLSSRKVNKRNTPVITIMQRLHMNDVSGYLLAKKSRTIKHICLPARKTDKVKPSYLVHNYVNGLLDSKRLSEDVLVEAKNDLGARDFAGQYEQTPSEEGGNIFKQIWFRKISYLEYQAVKGITPVHFFLDTAYTEKQRNDPTGIITTCGINGNLYIQDAAKVRMEFPALVKHIPNYVARNGYNNRSTVRIEPKASGLSVVQYLQANTKLNVVKTPVPIDSKETRAAAGSPKAECGRVYLVEGEWNEEFLEEVCNFPRAEHDEYVDILGYAIDYHLNSNNEYRVAAMKIAENLL